MFSLCSLTECIRTWKSRDLKIKRPILERLWHELMIHLSEPPIKITWPLNQTTYPREAMTWTNDPPFWATSLTCLLWDSAMKPITEKMTKPANTLVLELRHEIITASLGGYTRRQWEVGGIERFYKGSVGLRGFIGDGWNGGVFRGINGTEGFYRGIGGTKGFYMGSVELKGFIWDRWNWRVL